VPLTIFDAARSGPTFMIPARIELTSHLVFATLTERTKCRSRSIYSNVTSSHVVADNIIYPTPSRLINAFISDALLEINPKLLEHWNGKIRARHSLPVVEALKGTTGCIFWVSWTERKEQETRGFNTSPSLFQSVSHALALSHIRCQTIGISNNQIDIANTMSFADFPSLLRVWHSV
jgi:hypothetical protein